MEIYISVETVLFQLYEMLNKVKRYLKNPYLAFGYDLIKTHPNWMSDKYYLSILWKMTMGYNLNWNDPKTYNEKLQWLKLHDHNPLYPILVDKYRVKKWVSEQIGEEYVIPTLFSYSSTDEIDLDSLPDQFVLKCNHDSGSVVICRDKSSFDLSTAKKKLAKALSHNYYWDAREWAYKKVPRCIIAEPYLEDDNSKELPDYKFFSFDGEVKALFIATDRTNPLEETKFDFYDTSFNHINVTNGHPNAQNTPNKPQSFDKMIQLARVLSKGLPHVRCDFYDVNGHVYFGELTFYHWGGMTKFYPQSFDQQMGEWIKLPK